jgi:hypothetical protein
MSQPETLWLQLINLVLGSVIFICCLAMGAKLFQTMKERSLNKIYRNRVQEEHTLILADLGITMADGGERVGKR